MVAQSVRSMTLTVVGVILLCIMVYAVVEVVANVVSSYHSPRLDTMWNQLHARISDHCTPEYAAKYGTQPTEDCERDMRQANTFYLFFVVHTVVTEHMKHDWWCPEILRKHLMSYAVGLAFLFLLLSALSSLALYKMGVSVQYRKFKRAREDERTLRYIHMEDQEKDLRALALSNAQRERALLAPLLSKTEDGEDQTVAILTPGMEHLEPTYTLYHRKKALHGRYVLEDGF